MKSIISFSKPFLYLSIAAVTVGMAGCTPESFNEELGAIPDAAFTVTPVANKINTYAITSTSPGAFMWQWDKGDGTGSIKGKEKDTVYYADKGSYTIKLWAFARGGYDTAVQVINVVSDDPAAVTPFKLLTGNSSKTWILDQPNGGALYIGPSDFSQTWWSNSAGDVTARSCQFNDEMTFYKDGKFVFDNKGDMWVDDEGGSAWPRDIGLSIGCHQMTEVPEKYQSWGSGTHSFKIVGNDLQVMGTGAFLGLYKVGQTGTATGPEDAITYSIVSITADKLVIKKDYGWGAWRFTFKAK